LLALDFIICLLLSRRAAIFHTRCKATTVSAFNSFSSSDSKIPQGTELIMSELLVSTTRVCNISAIDIPSIAAALRLMKKEISNASLLLPKIHDASTSLWATIKKSHYVEMSARQEVSALNRSACNLQHNLTLAISEIEERIASLEVILSTEAIIPAILSTPDDLSVAFYIAVNGPDIDWPRAEAVLERFLFIWTEQGERMIDSFIRQNVWDHNNFESNIIKLIKGGDCWRVRKSLKLIQNVVVDCTDLGVNVEVFDSLASMLLHPLRSSAEDAELKWVYLITKNQDSAIDSDISRLINSFLYSRKGRSSIVHNVLNIISAFVFVQMDHNDAYDTFQ
jgi:hypothetical protein